MGKQVPTMKYKIRAFDEVNDVYLLYRQVWWIFYSFVSAGSQVELERFVESKGGILV